MGSHAARCGHRRQRVSLWSRLTSRRTRAAVALGAILSFGAIGTMAYWTDEATMTTGTIQAGTLDIRLLNSATLVGQGGTWHNANFTAANLLPGESVAFSFPARNDGTAPFRFTATGAATGALAPGLRFTVTHGSSTANNQGSAAAGNRAGTCGANTVASSNLTYSASPTTAISSPGVLLPPGNLTTVCIIVAFDSSASNALQGTTATTTFVFNAVQATP